MNLEKNHIKFVQISDDQYVLNRKDKDYDIGEYYFYSTIYTPTHVVTYPNGNPNDFRYIKEIQYTKSKVSFHKDFNSNKCCIDIYDDKTNPNKCRIIGQNGRTIFTKDRRNFDMYEVSLESNCFLNNKPRLIYVSHDGLYIVSKDENPVKNIIKNESNQFTFKGEVIEVSAIDGQRKVSGFDESNEIFIFNCPSDTSVSFEVEPTPIMKQIEEITGVKLVTPPPNDESALQRMSEILDVPKELLVIQNKKICMISPVERSPSYNTYSIVGKSTKLHYICYELESHHWNLWNSYKNQLEKYLRFIGVDERKTAIACGVIYSQEIKTYVLPKKDHLRKFALQPWPKIEKYDSVLNQIEKISGVRPQTSPPNVDSALNRVSELLNISEDLLTMIDGKVFMIYAFGRVSYNLKSIIDKFKLYIPPISYGNSKHQITEMLKYKDYEFDNSEEAKIRRREIALKPWDNI